MKQLSHRTLVIATACSVTVSLLMATTARAIDPASLSGLVLDDAQATLVGDWQSSQSSKPFIGESYIHDQDTDKGQRSATFTFRVPETDTYHVLIAYTANGNRARRVPVTIVADGRTETVHIDQTTLPAWTTGFQPVGAYPFTADADGRVVIETTDTRGHVVVDAVRLLDRGAFTRAAEAEARSRGPSTGVAVKSSLIPGRPAPPPLPAARVAVAKKPEPVPQQPAPQFVRRPASQAFATITPEDFDRLLEPGFKDHGETVELVDDIRFYRRVALDLVGRQPTLDEYHALLADSSADRREKVIERYLASPEFGANWANYWSDMIGARQEEPQLTFLNYQTLKHWLADEFNRGTGWDEIVFRMVTAVGKVGENPAGTFIGFHQGEPNRLAGEVTRVFLGVQIACAQCHDHPFVDLPQETFHGMAAFFARTTVKLPHNNSDQIDITSAIKGEHKMPGGKADMIPAVLGGDAVAAGLSDVDRRRQMADWVVSADSPYFARSFVNHLQARLMGRGFFDPIDNMGEGTEALLGDAHDALAAHLIASDFDLKSVFRVILRTRAYQRADRFDTSLAVDSFTGARPKKLRGDEVFASLVSAIELPNVTPPPQKATEAVRFPPPPKSTRDVVYDAFGFDPATRDELLTRTLPQAMLLMNNRQVQQQINAAPNSGTMLARLVAAEPDNATVVDVLYARVLARRPSDRERSIVLQHIDQLGDRDRAFEDVLWSLLNSAEFTTRY